MSNKVVILTGAAEGIGAAAANKFSEDGMKVALLDMSSELLDKTVSELQSKGRTVHGVVCDVTKKDQVFSAVEEVIAKWGTVDVCIANAGIAYTEYVEKAETDKWIEVVDVNVVGVLNCVAAVLPTMMKNNRGHLIFTSSIASRQGLPFLSQYSGSKSFLQGYAAGIRHELAPMGIKVTCIQPGFTCTRILDACKGSDPEVLEKLGATEDVRKHSALHPGDIAEAMAFCVNQPDRVAVNGIFVERSRLPFATV